MILHSGNSRTVYPAKALEARLPIDQKELILEKNPRTKIHKSGKTAKPYLELSGIWLVSGRKSEISGIRLQPYP